MSKVFRPPIGWTGPVSFSDWTEEDIAAMSKAIRVRGQPDNDGWRRQARICLNALRGGPAVELVARAIEGCLNEGRDPDRPISGGHYLRGMPHWCAWAEIARPAVAEYARKFKLSQESYGK